MIVIGKEIIAFEMIKSTNDYLKKNHAFLKDGTIVFSKQQSAGRGRNNHQWMSEEGNLYFSFIIKEKISRNNIFDFTVLTSMAVINLLKKLKINPKIKYPNDILVNDKKACGILIESSGSKEIDYLVVGVGINVNQVNFKDLDPYATSIKQILKEESQIEEILANFIEEYNLLKQTTYSKVFEEYLNYSMIIGRKIKIEEKISKIKAITKTGEIVIVNTDGLKQLTLNSINLRELF